MHEPDRAITEKPSSGKSSKVETRQAETRDDTWLSSTARIKLAFERNLAKGLTFEDLKADDINTRLTDADQKILPFIKIGDELSQIKPEAITEALKLPRAQLAAINEHLQKIPESKLKDTKTKEQVAKLQKKRTDLEAKMAAYETETQGLNDKITQIQKIRRERLEDAFRNPRNVAPDAKFLEPIKTEMKAVNEQISNSLRDINIQITRESKDIFDEASGLLPTQMPTEQQLRSQLELK